MIRVVVISGVMPEHLVESFLQGAIGQHEPPVFENYDTALPVILEHNPDYVLLVAVSDEEDAYLRLLGVLRSHPDTKCIPILELLDYDLRSYDFEGVDGEDWKAYTEPALPRFRHQSSEPRGN